MSLSGGLVTLVMDRNEGPEIAAVLKVQAAVFHNRQSILCSVVLKRSSVIEGCPRHILKEPSVYACQTYVSLSVEVIDAVDILFTQGMTESSAGNRGSSPYGPIAPLSLLICKALPALCLCRTSCLLGTLFTTVIMGGGSRSMSSHTNGHAFGLESPSRSLLCVPLLHISEYMEQCSVL